MEGKVEKSFNKANIIEAQNHIGRIIGNNNNGIIENCYSNGSLRAKQYIGGIIGFQLRSTSKCINSYSVNKIER